MWNQPRTDFVNGRDPARLEITRLMERMRGVAIENMDAIELMKKTAPLGDAVLYVDPPYPTVREGLYRHSQIDVAALTSVLHAQRGAVLVSGYGEEWDHLGWERREIPANSSINPLSTGGRVEVAWMNYPPGHELGLFYAD